MATAAPTRANVKHMTAIKDRSRKPAILSSDTVLSLNVSVFLNQDSFGLNPWWKARDGMTSRTNG
jgi:hypothetical protein